MSRKSSSRSSRKQTGAGVTSSAGQPCSWHYARTLPVQTRLTRAGKKSRARAAAAKSRSRG